MLNDEPQTTEPGELPRPGGAYHWDAADYAQHSAAQFAWASQLLGKLNLAPDQRVLDIGCGDGRVTAAIAASVPLGWAAGVDFSSDMIRLARSHFPRAEHPNLFFAAMDAARLGFAGGFDIAFSNAALHWVHDHVAVLAGVARSLRPGGRLLFQMGGRGNAPDMFALLGEMMLRPPWQSYFIDFAFPFAFYGPEEYAEWLPRAGLVPVRVELLPKDMAHGGREGLAGWIRTTWLPYLERLQEAMRTAFIDEVTGTYLERFGADADGTVHVRMVRLEVEAVKPEVPA